MEHDPRTLLDHLSALWRQEQEASRARFHEVRHKTPLHERIKAGVALQQLSVDEAEPASGGRTLLWLTHRAGFDLDALRLQPGDPAVLWWDSFDAADALRVVVARLYPERIGVMIEGDPDDDRLEEGGIHLDLDEPLETFLRGRRALQTFRDAEPRSPRAALRDVLLGLREAEQDPLPRDLTFFDSALNPPQQEAVALTLAARQLALIHGPPGTGKTRTLIEVIRQHVARGQRVLAAAASNTATDNLALRLVAAGVQIVRLGHPARISDGLEDHTLDALLARDPASRLAKQWTDEANRLRRRTERQWQRRTINWDQRKDARREVNRLLRDARKHLQQTQQAILSRAEVLCTTATGADSRNLSGQRFDLVVLDEATQAVDPIALVALARADRAVLAGDPRQLPPTVISTEAERAGLGTTFFERLEARSGAHLLRMLTVQHRMHSDLMAFPSSSMYGGRLQADPSVATHRLEDLPGVAPDPLRPGPLVFIDCAGKGWEDQQTEDDPSTFNRPLAKRTAAEVRRLLSRGLPPDQLAVITPYNAQVRLLRELLRPERERGLEIGSIDSFQGREREAIVVDLVRSNDDLQVGFLADTRRMNVAITRARRLLLVLGDSATIAAHPYYIDFLDACEILDAAISAWADDAEPLDPIPED